MLDCVFKYEHLTLTPLNIATVIVTKCLSFYFIFYVEYKALLQKAFRLFTGPNLKLNENLWIMEGNDKFQ